MNRLEDLQPNTAVRGILPDALVTVFAVSIGVDVAQLAVDSSLRVGFTFAGSEIAMHAIGY
jgi:putative Mn2+ efflux pump MntP